MDSEFGWMKNIVPGAFSLNYTHLGELKEETLRGRSETKVTEAPRLPFRYPNHPFSYNYSNKNLLVFFSVNFTRFHLEVQLFEGPRLIPDTPAPSHNLTH